MKKNSSKAKKVQQQNTGMKRGGNQPNQGAAARRRGKQPQSWGGRRVTIGLDLGDRKSHYCVFDGGSYLQESAVSTDPAAMKAVFGAMEPCRIALEVGTHSPWVSALLEQLGYEDRKSVV